VPSGGDNPARHRHFDPLLGTEGKAMKTRGSFFGLLALALTLLSLTLASMLGSSMDVLAQDASPAAASPVASPAAASDCGTIMQIGSADDTCLILIQASEAAGDLDLYIDGFEAVRKLSFTNVSGYFALPAGSHDLALVPAGGALGDAVVTVDNAQTEPGTAYELAVIGPSDDLQLLVNAVDLAPLPSGTEGTPLQNTRVRAIHAVPDAPAVNVSVIGGDIAERIFSDVTYPTVTDYIEKTAGRYRVLLDVPEASLPSIDLGESLFDGDTVYSIYAVGSIANGNLDAVEVAVNLATGATTTREIPPLLASEVAPLSDFAIYCGICDQLSGEVAFELSGKGYDGAGPGTLAPWGGGGDAVGALGAVPVEYGEGTLDDLNLGQLLGGRATSVVIRDAETGGVVACGEIGGVVQKADNFWQHDRLIIGLRPVGDSGVSGIATFTEDTGVLTDKINISVALVGAGDWSAYPDAGTPVAG
jgi:hypothetical protein